MMWCCYGDDGDERAVVSSQVAGGLGVGYGALALLHVTDAHPLTLQRLLPQARLPQHNTYRHIDDHVNNIITFAFNG